MVNKPKIAETPYSFEKFQQEMMQRGYNMWKRDPIKNRLHFVKEGGMSPVTINYPDFQTEDGRPAYEKNYVVDFFFFLNGLRPDDGNGFHFNADKG